MGDPHFNNGRILSRRARVGLRTDHLHVRAPAPPHEQTDNYRQNDAEHGDPDDRPPESRWPQRVKNRIGSRPSWLRIRRDEPRPGIGRGAENGGGRCLHRADGRPHRECSGLFDRTILVGQKPPVSLQRPVKSLAKVVFAHLVDRADSTDEAVQQLQWTTVLVGDGKVGLIRLPDRVPGHLGRDNLTCPGQHGQNTDRRVQRDCSVPGRIGVIAVDLL